MSYEHGTTHYNLPLTEGTDKRDWFDTNQAFEDVDAALFAASEAAGSASADVDQIKEDVTALQGRMTTAEGDIDNVEASQATQAEQIINLTNRVNSVVVQTENKFNSVAVADAYDPSSTYSVDDYCTYDGNLYQCITEVTTGEPFDADKWVAVDLISLIGGSGAIAASGVTLAAISGMTATNVQDGIAEHQNDLDAIDSQLTANSKDFQFSYSGDKYGYTIDGVFHPFETGNGYFFTKTRSVSIAAGATENVTFDFSNELSSISEICSYGLQPSTGYNYAHITNCSYSGTTVTATVIVPSTQPETHVVMVTVKGTPI